MFDLFDLFNLINLFDSFELFEGDKEEDLEEEDLYLEFEEEEDWEE